jgi:septum site-determining protein MinC
MAVSSKASATAVFDLKSATLSVLALLLKTPDLAQVADALDSRYGATPNLFDHEPLCIDLSLLREADEPIDFLPLIDLLMPYGLNPIAARGGSAAQMAAAVAAGLAESPDEPAPARQPAERVPAPPMAEEAEPDEPAPAALPAGLPSTTLIIDKPLRSGQQVYARGGDLIVLAVVSFGAEVIADGSIHVYAPLRGRALAGARGNAEARIFAACMEPQLVSIAGTWRTFDTSLPPDVAGKPAQIRLVGDSLQFDPLKF